jgi:hypothetical protein
VCRKVCWKDYGMSFGYRTNNSVPHYLTLRGRQRKTMLPTHILRGLRLAMSQIGSDLRKPGTQCSIASLNLRHLGRENVALSIRKMPNSQGSSKIPAISTDRQFAWERLQFSTLAKSRQHRNKPNRHVASREIRRDMHDAQRISELDSFALCQQLSTCC